ncbi:sigma 54-interacting transcriptional regulator [Balneola sp. MJW-20]|uniref:sigma 54-interacting transcriptional regulator n=1 Tax=Gracilimonas aurantiaca TaxID=3234185 RepID=UPI003465EDB9
MDQHNDFIDDNSVSITIGDIESNLMRDIMDKIEELSKTRSNIVISGEHGTGKRWLANMIHSLEDGNNIDFCHISCDQIQSAGLDYIISSTKENVINSERCNILIDNFSELNVSSQIELLECIIKLQENNQGYNSNTNSCRFIFTVNNTWQQKNYDHYVWTYLTDLLNPISILIPPLREHREDIRPFSRLFLKQIARHHQEQYGESRQLTISNQALHKCISYPWPGNIRQFKNALTHAYFSTKGNVIQPEDLPISLEISSLFDPKLLESTKSWSFLNAEKKLRDQTVNESSLIDFNIKEILFKLISNR